MEITRTRRFRGSVFWRQGCGMKWFIALSLMFASPACAAEGKRNVILFVCDDLGFQLGCYGDRAAKTPNIDAMAAEGTRFTRAFCTTASCSPSRAVILSGLYSHANGQYGLEHASHHFSAHKNLRTLPVLLTAGGVRTARAGKFHVGPEETFHFESALPGNARDATKMAENCRAFLTAADPRPFFLYFCPADPHRSGPRRGDPLGGPDAFGNPREEPDGATFDPKAIPVPSWLPDSEPCRAELAQYYQSIARVDRGLGRLRALLKETGRDKDTMIIFTSDNGPPWPGAKTTTYEPGVNLPLIICDPHAEKRGLVSEAMISWVDLTPTVLDACGVSVPARPRGFHGVSIMPAVAAGKLDRPAEVYPFAHVSRSHDVLPGARSAHGKVEAVTQSSAPASVSVCLRSLRVGDVAAHAADKGRTLRPARRERLPAASARRTL